MLKKPAVITDTNMKFDLISDYCIMLLQGGGEEKEVIICFTQHALFIQLSGFRG